MKYLKYILILILFIGFSGCSDFFDINESPNNPTRVPVQNLLPSGLASAGFANGNELNRFASTIMNYNAGAGNAAAFDRYNIDGANFGNQWTSEIYGVGLNSMESMIASATAINATAYSGIGKIVKAYLFGLATDCWGDIPYREALKGAQIPAPRLDTQEDIYKGNETLGVQSLFSLIREGIADLNTTSSLTVGADDIAYNGNLANWRRAGYTLMLKFAVQMRKREPALAAQIINEVITADHYIKLNSENWGINFGTSTDSQSPIYFWTNLSSFKDELLVSTRYRNRLESLNDPRLPLFVTRPTGNYVTVENGFNGTFPTPTTTWSRWSDVVTGVGGRGPIRLLTNAQRCFILAEAALTIPGVNLPAGQTAQSLYEDGIRASMQLAGMTATDITTYFDDNLGIVTLSGSIENQLEQIITQKYIASTGNSVETWHDWRRTGYPVMPENLNAAGIDGTRPVRLLYLSAEIATNPNFPNPAIQSNVKVWWDVD